MIRRFWVKNYLSIKDKQELNFETKKSDSPLVVEVENNVYLYKLGVLFGPNASGKSNMLQALNTVFQLLVTSRSSEFEDVVVWEPFKLAEKDYSEMFVSFYADRIRYDYSVIFDDSKIIKEQLHYYPNNYKVLFYERTFTGTNLQSEIKFGPSLGLKPDTQDTIRNNTLNNHSVLSVCRKIALKEDGMRFSSLYSWIMSNYHDVDGDGMKGVVEILKNAYDNPPKRKFFNLMLAKADLNIIDFRPIPEDRVVPKEILDRFKNNEVPKVFKDALLSTVYDTISFLNHSDDGDFAVPLRLQSMGTQKYIEILDALYDMISSPHVYYLDELGEDLHADLLMYYLSVFIYNSSNSQLIITSQELTLLAQDLLNENRGAVWFVEKNKSTASSEYARADSFGLHKNLSLYNSYVIGRLGAKPELGSIFLNLDE